MAYNWAARRATATRMITKFGAKAILRRADGDRDCIAVEDNATPRSHQGELRNMPEHTFLVVAEGLDPPPDSEKDHLVWLPGTPDEKSFRLNAPIGKLAPAGVVLYYELQTRR